MRAESGPPSSHSNKETPTVFVSACLAGENCRYDGGTCPDPEICRLAAAGAVRTGCPECLGGLSTPRMPAEIEGGDGDDVLDGRARVLCADGTDVTEAYIAGAQAFVRDVLASGCREVILKAKSPSCGVGCIYDGTHSGLLRRGPGVTAALLRRSGITVREK